MIDIGNRLLILIRKLVVEPRAAYGNSHFALRRRCRSAVWNGLTPLK